MMNTKNVVLVAVAFAVACGIAGLVVITRQAPNGPAPPIAKGRGPSQPARTADNVVTAASPAEAAPAVAPAPIPAVPGPAVQRAPPPVEPPRAAPRTPNSASQAAPGGGSGREPLQDPLAREALALVGASPIAEAYWYDAINDPTLPAQERQDLIEDLNEDGISDPKHPGPSDLPLILSRIRLIEATEPSAMDQVNLDAFQEAYKDLVDLANVALGGGEPVR